MHLRLLKADISATERWHAGPITGLSVVGTRLFSAGQDKRILSFERLPSTGRLRFVGPELNAALPITDMQAAWSGDAAGFIVAAACHDSHLRVWLMPRGDNGGGGGGGKLAAGQAVEHALSGHAASIRSVDVQLSFVLSASDDASAKVWDLHAGREVVTLWHPESVMRALFFPGSTLLVTACTDHATRIWDLRAGADRPAYAIREPGEVSSTEVGGLATCAGGLLASADSQGQVRLFDAPRSGARCLSRFRLPTVAPALQFVSDGRYLACAGRDGDLYTVRLEDLAAQSFTVQQGPEPKSAIVRLRSSLKQSQNLLVYAFEKEGWGFGVLEEISGEDVEEEPAEYASLVPRRPAAAPGPP